MRKSARGRRRRNSKTEKLGRRKVGTPWKDDHWAKEPDYPGYRMLNIPDVERLTALYSALRHVMFAHQLTLGEAFPEASTITRWEQKVT